MPEEDILEYIRIPPQRKIIKSSIYNLCRFRMFAKKEQSFQNNPKNSYTQRKVKHKPSGYSWDLICLFDATKNRCKFYRRKDYIEKFCKDVKELAIESSNHKEHKMIP